MRDHFLAVPDDGSSVDDDMAGPVSTSTHDLTVPDLVEGIEVVELPERKQRKLTELRNHIDGLLNEGWQISTRNPLTLQRDSNVCYVLHGMLVSDTLS